MKDIKKKFLDILFEPTDDEPEQVDEAVEEVEKKPIKEESSVKAKDILYRKSEGSAFIDLNDLSKPTSSLKEEKNEENYEFASQISPIFGVLKESKRRPVKLEKESNDSIVNKPEDSHLEIITSPIYGYGDQEDVTGNRNMTAGLLADESELHDLFDDKDLPVETEENFEENLVEDDYYKQEEYFDEEDYSEEGFEPEEYEEYFDEDYDDQQAVQQEDDSIFMHQRYDIDEGEITLFDTIEDEE